MKFRAAMLVPALVGLGASAAEAQFFWPDGPSYYEGLPARVVMRAVRAQGLTPVSPMMRRGDVYFVRAVDPSGRVSRVMIDAYSGHIMRIEANVRRGREPGLPPLNRPRPRDDGRDYAMRPPRALPEAAPRVLPADPYGARELDAPSAETGVLPPPPAPGALRSAKPAESSPGQTRPSRREGARTAAIHKNPPSPRPRPATREIPQASEASKHNAPAAREAAVPPSTPAEQAAPPAVPVVPPAATEPEQGPSAKPATPRVILPGPVPKEERTAETQQGDTAPATTAEAPAPATAEPSPAGPGACGGCSFRDAAGAGTGVT